MTGTPEEIVVQVGSPADESGPQHILRDDPLTDLLCGCIEEVAPEVAGEDAELRAVIDDREATIVLLESRVEVLRDQVETAKERHRNDVNAIGEALLEGAEKRKWCDEVDDFVEELNQRLNVKLPLRKRDYVVRVEVYVTASSGDTAEETATEAMGKAMSNGGYEYQVISARRND